MTAKHMQSGGAISDTLVYYYRLVIRFVDDSSEPHWRGYFYAVVIFVVTILQAVVLTQYLYISSMVGMRIRAALCGAVYNKVCFSHLSPHGFIFRRLS